MEKDKLNKDKTETRPNKAGFFYRRIGTTLYKVSVFTSDTETDTFADKVFRVVHNEIYEEDEALVQNALGWIEKD